MMRLYFRHFFRNVVPVIVLLTAFLTGCSGQTETAHEAETAAIEPEQLEVMAESPPEPDNVSVITVDEPDEITIVPEIAPDDASGSDDELFITEPEIPESDDTFVRVQDYITDIAVDLRYATENNFTGTVIYEYEDAWLRYGTVKKLAVAQTILKEHGYRLCIWDAFRTHSAQKKLWDVCPDGNYVSNPSNGYSGHTRGDTIDVTLVTLDGEAVEMPSEFDNFTASADRDYSDVSYEAADAARLLEQAMEECGFEGYSKEWWHYSDTNRYSPALDFEPPT